MVLSTKMKAERYLFEKGVLHDCVVEMMVMVERSC